MISEYFRIANVGWWRKDQNERHSVCVEYENCFLGKHGREKRNYSFISSSEHFEKCERNFVLGMFIHPQLEIESK